MSYVFTVGLRPKDEKRFVRFMRLFNARWMKDEREGDDTFKGVDWPYGEYVTYRFHISPGRYYDMFDLLVWLNTMTGIRMLFHDHGEQDYMSDVKDPPAGIFDCKFKKKRDAVCWIVKLFVQTWHDTTMRRLAKQYKLVGKYARWRNDRYRAKLHAKYESGE